MAAIGTKLVIEAAVRLGTLIDANARDAGRQLGEWLRPWLRDGETLPDFTLVLQLPARMIRQSGRHLRGRQSQLDDSRSDHDEARLRRDQTAAALRRKLIEIRRLLTAALGPRRAAALLGIKGKTAKGPQHALLRSQADACLKLLRDPRRLAIAETDHTFDPAAVAGTLELLVAAFRQASSHLDEVGQANAARLDARDRARTELGRAVQCVVCLLSGWLLLIRRTDLAKKLRRIAPAPRTKPAA